MPASQQIGGAPSPAGCPHLAPGKDARATHTHTAPPLHSEPTLRSAANRNHSPPKSAGLPTRFAGETSTCQPFPATAQCPQFQFAVHVVRVRAAGGAASLHRAQARRARRVRRTARHVHMRAWGRGVGLLPRVAAPGLPRSPFHAWPEPV